MGLVLMLQTLKTFKLLWWRSKDTQGSVAKLVKWIIVYNIYIYIYM